MLPGAGARDSNNGVPTVGGGHRDGPQGTPTLLRSMTSVACRREAVTHRDRRDVRMFR